jgi:NADPH:quinone reductase-like Zn-dependent oxidoreductase
MNPGVLDEAQADLVRLHAEGAVRPLIRTEVQLDEVPAAIGRLVGRGTVGKVVAIL